MIWAVILAAGESKRMGTQKLLLPWGESSVIETIAATAAASAVDGILVTLGSDREKVRERLETHDVAFAVNEDYNRGMLSSVQTAFRLLPVGVRAAVLLLGDQPAVPSEVIDELIARFLESGRGLVIPTHKGRRGHPVLIDLKHKAEINSLAPEIGLRQLIRRHAEDILDVEVASEAILKDMDYLEDYARETENE